jgi:hypothetical protein
MKGLAKLALKGALIGGELLIDWLTGKLERKTEPTVPWTHAETEIKAKAQRCAGHETEPQCER